MLDGARRKVEDAIEQIGQLVGQIAGVLGLGDDVLEVPGRGRVLHVVHRFDFQGLE